MNNNWREKARQLGKEAKLRFLKDMAKYAFNLYSSKGLPFELFYEWYDDNKEILMKQYFAEYKKSIIKNFNQLKK